MPDPRSWLRLRRRRLGAAGLLALAVVLLVAWADRQGWRSADVGDQQRYHGRRCLVRRVLDGDTIEVAVPDGSRANTRVRLWGLDAAEVAHPEFGRPADEPYAREAAALARELAQGREVRLELEARRSRDRYGRVLAHVQLPDGTSLNERLLAAGLARADARPGNPDYQHSRVNRYAQVEHQARLDGAGLWSGRGVPDAEAP